MCRAATASGALIYAITLLQEKIQKERGTIKKALNLS